MARSKSSKRWLSEHFSDLYVKQAWEKGYRSRAAFKLLEIQERDKILRPGMVVVDLGAAPGGWAQCAVGLIGEAGKIIAIDLLDMEAIPRVHFIQGDFAEPQVQEAITTWLQGRSVDLVISDLAPNMSGVASVDQPRAMRLSKLAQEFALEHLVQGGDFLLKAFQGVGYDEFLRELRQGFSKVVIRKPKASRNRSQEVYLLARGRR